MDTAAAEKPRIAVIGAGLSGLSTLKECLAEGFDVQCFEARPEIGGQWAYQPVSADKPESSIHSSVYDGAMLNSCRDTSSYPDFPLDPARYGDYLSHRAYLQYMNEYADHFGLKKHIRLETKVLECRSTDSGSWVLRVQQNGHAEEELPFSAVCTSIGHLSSPYTPDFAGLQSYKGEFFHSHYYRTPGRFAGKRVAIIGFSSSAVDIACEIAPHAQELHLITRRGGYVMPRFVFGKPTEAWDNRATQVWLPASFSQWAQDKLLNLVEGKPPKEMEADHKILEQLPTIRSDFMEKVRTKVIAMHRGVVQTFTETGVFMDNGEALDVDVVICCTGYNQFDYPFLPSDVVRTADTPAHTVDLYKLIIPPRYPNLFMMGLLELVGPAAPAVDAQARWVTSVMKGRITLPPQEKMLQEIRHTQERRHKQFLNTERHTLAIHVVEYVDDLLRPLGAVPSFGKLFGRIFTSGHPWRSLQLLNAVWFGIPSSAQWRLCGYGAKEQLATATVLRIAAEKDELSPVEKKMIEQGV